ncbi:MAG TPA: glycosyltransferase [Methylomirabilota bacterium]|nr:glycosyltransferase [Methylomirabilota bacterium]
MRRAVLLVAYHFPPDAAVGAVRVAKLARTLVELGWHVSVVTVREDRLHRRDPGRLADVAGCRVWRAAEWPTLPELVGRAGRRLGGGRAAAAPAAPGPGRGGEGPGGGGIGATLRRYALSLGELPDAQVGWLAPAAWRAIQVVRRERIRVVVTSSPPRTTALVGAAVSRLTAVPLVTDLRDPWYWPELRDPADRTALGDRIARRLEAALVRRSRRVVVTTSRYAEALRRAHPWLPADRVATIWNGFDREAYGEPPPPVPGAPLRIAYFGSLYLGRTPRELFRALAELLAEGAVAPGEIEVELVGEVAQAGGEPVAAMLEAYGLAGCVRLRPPVPHREALRQMQAADVLLLLAPAQPYCIPAKAFEYLGAGRRILCVADDGATGDLIRRTDGGLIVAPDDVAGMKAALVGLLRAHPAPPRPVPAAAEFDRAVLMRRYAELLEDVLRTSASHAGDRFVRVASPSGGAK